MRQDGGMGGGQRTSPWRLLGQLWAPLTVLAGVEVLALGPKEAWSSPRIWLVQLVGTGIVALLVWLGALLIERVLRLLGRRPSGTELGLWLLTVVVGCGQAWELVGLRLPVPGRLLQLVALAGLFSLGYAAVRGAASRLGRDPRGLGLGFAALLAVLIFFQAARQNLLWSSAFASAQSLMLVLVGSYAALALAVLLWGGARRAVCASALLLLGVVLLRATTTNAFELHVMETSEPSKASGPPVLLIVLDTFRADAADLSGEGSRTPNLARFAREADVYTHAISNASWTLPGHASIFTGQPLARHRTDFTARPGFHASVPADLHTVHQIFKDNGYRTTCVPANGVLSPATGLLRGCQRYCHPGRLWLASTLPLRLVFMLSRSAAASRGISLLVIEIVGVHPSAEAEEVVDRALDEMEGESPGRYVFLNFMDVHDPYPAPRATPFLGRLAYRRDILLMLAGRMSYETLAQSHADMLRASYKEQAQVLDRELGRLFDTLRQRGWYDRMLIAVTADHGEAFWENASSQSYFGHHGAYEPVVHIPLMVKQPGQRRGSVFHHYVQQVSILPALLKGAGLAAPAGLASSGLEADAARGPIVTEWYPLIRGDRHFLPWARFGVYKERYKYVLENTTHESLFDLERGRYESANVIDQEPLLTDELRQELAAAVKPGGEHGPGEQPSREMEEHLRALGYVN